MSSTEHMPKQVTLISYIDRSNSPQVFNETYTIVDRVMVHSPNGQPNRVISYKDHQEAVASVLREVSSVLEDLTKGSSIELKIISRKLD